MTSAAFVCLIKPAAPGVCMNHGYAASGFKLAQEHAGSQISDHYRLRRPVAQSSQTRAILNCRRAQAVQLGANLARLRSPLRGMPQNFMWSCAGAVTNQAGSAEEECDGLRFLLRSRRSRRPLEDDEVCNRSTSPQVHLSSSFVDGCEKCLSWSVKVREKCESHARRTTTQHLDVRQVADSEARKVV